MAMERTTVVGVFRERHDAERAIEELRRLGLRDDQIGFMMRGGESGLTHGDDDNDNRAGEAATGGMVTGGLIGGALAAGSLLIPGIGPVLAGGILATILGGAAAGGAVGGLVGMLVGSGIPDEEARYYEGELNEGRILVTVSAGSRYQEIRDVLRRHGAYDIEGGPATGTVGTGRAGVAERTDIVDRDTVRLHEERLEARTQPAEAGHGGVDLHGVGGGIRSWSETSPEYRQRWQSRYGTLGGRFEEYEPFYRYGHEMSTDARYRDREWRDVEPDLRRDYGMWARTHGYEANENAWERFKDAVQDSWDSVRGRRRAA